MAAHAGSVRPPSLRQGALPPEGSVGFSSRSRDPTQEPASLPLSSGESEAGGANGRALRGRPEAGD